LRSIPLLRENLQNPQNPRAQDPRAQKVETLLESDKHGCSAKPSYHGTDEETYGIIMKRK
jgi:hypothetical protein